MKLHAHADLRLIQRRILKLGSLRKGRSWTIIAAIAIEFVIYTSAIGADVTSTWNVANGNWGIAGNWNPNTNFPNNGTLTYDAVLGNNGTITLDQNITIQKYTQSNGTLGGTGNFTLTLNELMTWSGGTVGGNGILVANGGITLSGAGTKQLGNGANTGRTLINNGTTTLSGGDTADLLISTSGGGNPGSMFTNNGTFNVTDDADIVFNSLGGSPSSFANTTTGVFNKSGTGTTTQIIVASSNSGVVNVNSGTLNYAGQFTQTAGSLNLLGGSISGILPLNIQGGTVTGNGTITGSVVNSGGTIAPGVGSGAISISGDLSLGNSSTLSIEIGGLAQGTQYDFLSEAGSFALTLDGTLTLSFINGFQGSVSPTDTFTVFTSNQVLLGAFDNVANGARLNLANAPGSFQVNYGAGSPFGAPNVVLSAFVIPEPSAAVLVALGFASLVLRRRVPRDYSGPAVDGSFNPSGVNSRSVKLTS